MVNCCHRAGMSPFYAPHTVGWQRHFAQYCCVSNTRPRLVIMYLQPGLDPDESWQALPETLVALSSPNRPWLIFEDCCIPSSSSISLLLFPLPSLPHAFPYYLPFCLSLFFPLSHPSPNHSVELSSNMTLMVSTSVTKTNHPVGFS